MISTKKSRRSQLALLMLAASATWPIIESKAAKRGVAQAPSTAGLGGFDERGNSPPANGFGAPPAGNPFVSGQAQGGKGDYEDYGDDELDEIGDDVLRQRMEQRLREKAMGSGGAPMNYTGDNNPDYTDTAPSARPVSGFVPPNPRNPTFPPPNAPSMGGNPGGVAGGMASNSRSPGCLRLDPDTGYGPDVVSNFDFPEADIVEIAKTLGRLTCLNFILDKEVKGRISIVSNAPITIGDAWKAFLTALDVNQLTVLPSGKYLRIAKQRDAKDKQLKIYPGNFAPDTDGMITRVMPLKYINAEEVRRVFMNISAPNTRILAYEQTNTLIVTDTGANIKKIADLVALLDVEGFDEGLEVIKIKFASAEEIAKLIDQLLPGAGQTPGFPGGAPGAPRFGSRGQRKPKEGGVISHIIADGRTNSLIVNANSKGAAQVRELVSKLDTKVAANAGGSRIHVVYLQFADAEEVSKTLSSLTQGSGATNPKLMGGMPGMSSSSSASLFEGSVKVAADKPTNSIVVTASPTDFTLVKRVLSKLDVPRDQVYVEAIIMEMALNKSFELGTSVISAPNGVGFMPNSDLANFLTNPLAGVQGLALGFKAGNQMSVPLPTGGSVAVNSVNGLIRALQQNTNAHVLATPQILTLDNQDASIEIGETVPVPTTSQVANAGVATSFTREKVSLMLKIKPQINKISNFVKLDIDQKLEDFSNRVLPKGVADQAFGTTSRASKTTVVVQDQDTVVLGGLIRDKVNETSTKVPILGDIPVLGWLFRNKTTTTDKTNLLVFITPRIIKQYQTVRNILDKKVQERDEFLQKTNGGEDPYQEAKMRMIKELPPEAELKSGYRVENSDEEEQDDSSEDNIRQMPSAFKPVEALPQTQQALAPSAVPLPTVPVIPVAPVTPVPAAPQVPVDAPPTSGVSSPTQ